MSTGLLVFIALTIVVFRHAVEVGRRPLLWVVLLWHFGIVGGALFGAAALLVAIQFSEGTMTQAEAHAHMFAPTVIGMLLGAAATVLAVNRTTSSDRVQNPEDVQSKDGRV